MKLMAALALAGGLIAAPVATANAAPPSATCDGAGCVTYVSRGVEAGGPCIGGTRYVFGLTASGRTLRCNSTQQWAGSPPLVGIRTNSSACNGSTGVAQSPGGIPLGCIDGTWRPDFGPSFF